MILRYYLVLQNLIEVKESTTYLHPWKLVEHRAVVREVVGSNLGQTNTQGL